MENYGNHLQIFSYVKYVGHQRNDLKNKIGEVVGRVENSPALICEFGGDSYILDPINLQEYKHNNSDSGIDAKILRRWQVADDGDKPKKSKSK